MMQHRIGFVTALAVIVTGSIASAAGDISAASEKLSPPHNGSFTTRIALGDDIALSYDSSRRNGFVGVGWQLEGVHFIERASKGGGAPTYTATDVFMLDGGDELIPDTSLGGTHSTKRQSFLRISFDATANTWRIRERDGTEIVLTPSLVPIAGKTFRWAAATSTDTHGRVTTYSYGCGALQCYLYSIAHADGPTIEFLRETRPVSDVLTFATGASTGQTSMRLKSIVVRVGGTIKRAFGLAYTASEKTSMSKLASVREYGRDAVVNADYSLTGASILRFSAEYTPELGDTFTAKPDIAWCSGASFVLMHHDADSKADAHCRVGPSATGGYVYTRLSVGDGTFAAAKTWAYSAGWCGTDDSLSMGGDYNGDGKQDLMCIDGTSTGAIAGTYRVAVSTGAGTFAAYGTWPASGSWCAGGGIINSDVNADGKTDLICRTANSQTSSAVALATTSGAFASVGTGITGVWTSPLATETFAVYSADVNGDDRRDIIFRRFLPATATTAAKSSLRVAFSNGNGTFRLAPIWADPYYYMNACDAGIVFVDLNADGKLDVSCTRTNSTTYTWQYSFLSLGDGTFKYIGQAGWLDTTATQKCSVTYGDFNADGRVDYLCSYYDATTGLFNGKHRISLNGYSPMVQQTLWTSAISSSAQIRVVDVTGDGRSDIVRSFGTGYATHSVEISTGGVGYPLLSKLANGFGGSLELTYTPSSAWTATYLPAGTIVQTLTRIIARDGRAGTSPITTTYSYAGANWDRVEQRFLGFRTARATDATGAYTQTTFTQHVADAVGTAERSDEKDASGNLYTYKSRTFSRTGNGTTVPYVSHPTETWDFECNGNASCKSARTTRVFDVHGNVTAEYDYGSAACGDERAVTTQFAKNTASYIVSLPWEVRVSKATCGTTCNDACTADAIGAMFTRTYYDGSASLTAAPVRGDATKVENWLAQANKWVANTMTYDGYGNRLTITDALGKTTSTTYDTTYHRFPLTEINPLGQSTTKVWDYVCSKPTAETDPNGAITRTTYDMLCRPTRVDHPDASWQLTNYNDALRGQPDAYFVHEASSDGTADGLWTKSYVDGLEREYKVVSEPDQTVDTIYDARGLVQSTSAPHATGETARRTTTSYDAVRRPTRVTHPSGHAITTVYDDWIKTTYNELGVPLRHEYDSDGQLALTTEYVADGVGGYIAYTTTASAHDHVGRLVSITDAEGNDTILTYDTMSRKTSMNDPDMGSWVYTYDDAGRVILQTDARGRIITFEYDALGRLTRKLRGTTVLEQRFYDEAGHGASKGRLTRLVDASGSSSFSYDVMGRTTQQTQSTGAQVYTITRGYDSGGRLANLTYPDGEVVKATYDTAGRLRTVGSYVTAATYDARGALTGRMLGNGLSEKFSYDLDRGWLTVATIVGPVVSDQSFSYAADGQLLAKTNWLDATDSWTYNYDSLSRVTKSTNVGNTARSQSLGYSPIGDITSQTGVGTYLYPASGMARPHAPLAAGTSQFTYDANGNRLSDNGGATLSYAYDDLNRLVTAKGVAYAYNGLGDRVRAGDTTYMGNLYEESPLGATKYYTFAGKRIAKRVPGGVVYYYHGDQIDTTSTLTSSTGAVAAKRVYSVLGQRLAATGIGDPFGLAGQRQDASGLYHMSARFMDPRAGQFTQPDPSGDPDPAEPQKLNRYAYVYNRPTTMVDPTGLWGMQGNDPSDNHYNGGISGGGVNASRGGSSSGGNGYSGSGRDRGTRSYLSSYRNSYLNSYRTSYRNLGYNPGSNRYNGGYISSGSTTVTHTTTTSYSRTFGFSTGSATTDPIAANDRRHLRDNLSRVLNTTPRTQQAAENLDRAIADFLKEEEEHRDDPFWGMDEKGSWKSLKKSGRPTNLQRNSNSSSRFGDPWGMVNQNWGKEHQSDTHGRAGGCFVAGTQITMADGSTLPIERVRIGDVVRSFDERSGEVTAARVSQTFFHASPGNDIVVINGTLRATANHPIYVSGAWRPAGELAIGDVLQSEAKSVRVDGLEVVLDSEPVYNLEVEGTHTYFAEGILVHNKEAPHDPNGLNDEPIY